jgi:hypothetical protein
MRSSGSPQARHGFFSISKPSGVGPTSLPPSVIRPSGTGGTSSPQIGHEYFPMLQRCPSRHVVSAPRRLYEEPLRGRHGSAGVRGGTRSFHAESSRWVWPTRARAGLRTPLRPDFLGAARTNPRRERDRALEELPMSASDPGDQLSQAALPSPPSETRQAPASTGGNPRHASGISICVRVVLRSHDTASFQLAGRPGLGRACRRP